MCKITLFTVLLLWSLLATAQQSVAASLSPHNPTFLTELVQIEQSRPTTTPQAGKAAQAAFEVLITALETNDYAAFSAVGDDAFKAALTKEAFEQIRAQVAPRMKKGYETTYFGALKQQGYDVYLWKMSFKDEGDDLLIKLAMKDGKVSGFFFV